MTGWTKLLRGRQAASEHIGIMNMLSSHGIRSGSKTSTPRPLPGLEGSQRHIACPTVGADLTAQQKVRKKIRFRKKTN
jgi:hypothetical protein